MNIGYEDIIIEKGAKEYIVSMPVKFCYGYIYGIYNTKLKKIVYIGQSQFHGKNTYNRQRNYYGSGIIIKRFIKKYGKDLLVKFLIDDADTPEELDQLEIKYIKEYNTKIPNGWNVSSGGQGVYHKPGGLRKHWHHTEETKARISASSKKMWKNEETRQRLIEAAKKPNSGQFKKGNIPWHKGFNKSICPQLAHTEKAKRTISVKLKEYRKRMKNEVC